MRSIREHGVTIVAGVPTMFGAFLELSDVEAPADAFRSVRLAVSGAAEMPQERFEEFRDRFGVTIFEGYGLTEASPIVSTNAIEDAPRWGSIGPPLPGVDVRLVGDDGEDVFPGDPGEILVQGPNVFTGYWQDVDATERVLEGGWLHTGDVAVADDEGYLRLVDRKKDLVIVSGFNVFPAEVEDVLLEHPEIVDAAVIGVPHAARASRLPRGSCPRPARRSPPTRSGSTRRRTLRATRSRPRSRSSTRSRATRRASCCAARCGRRPDPAYAEGLTVAARVTGCGASRFAPAPDATRNPA